MSTYLALLLASTLTKALDTFLDPTFSGIHQLDWFDWALMIPYFSVLIILSAFGLHRYEIIRGYLKHKKKLTDGPASRFEQEKKLRSSESSEVVAALVCEGWGKARLS